MVNHHKIKACCGNCNYYLMFADTCGITAEGTNFVDWCERWELCPAKSKKLRPLEKLAVRLDDEYKRAKEIKDRDSHESSD